jgi:hypothetical protein
MVVGGYHPALRQASGELFQLSDSDLERQFTLLENSTDRERLVRPSHNTAGWDLNVTSLQSEAAVHPLTVTLESGWSTKLSECLRCPHVV